MSKNPRFPLQTCANGCGIPPCPPSLVICRKCMDKMNRPMTLSRRQRNRLLYLYQLMDVVEPETEYLPVCATPVRIVRNATY